MVSSDVGKEGGGPWSSAGCGGGGGGGCGGSSSGLRTFKQSSHNVGVLASFPVLHLSILLDWE